MSDKRKANGEEHIFVKPQVTSLAKRPKTGHPFPPSWVEHEEDEISKERRKESMNSWLQEIADDNRQKILKDETTYFVIDFGIEVNHPIVASTLQKLGVQVLGFLNDSKKNRSCVIRNR